mmetsp:Transcript_3456/g.7461  ORF Transcript_3456/g.7461 Transcript_3456/m.7461 type:complete len:158 (+) Transcript_3456:424-897(+)
MRPPHSGPVPSLNRQQLTSWEYIRVSCLGILPGLVCPHHDRVQSNGVLRAEDFNGMLQRHAGERGICIDHWAALVVNNGSYRVLSVPDRSGSVGPDGEFTSDDHGRPGVWVKECSADGSISARVAPSEGSLGDLLRCATEIVRDRREDQGGLLNPIE